MSTAFEIILQETFPELASEAQKIGNATIYPIHPTLSSKANFLLQEKPKPATARQEAIGQNIAWSSFDVHVQIPTIPRKIFACM